jgi:hypothetical protein
MPPTSSAAAARVPSVREVFEGSGAEAMKALGKLSDLTGISLGQLLKDDIHKGSSVPFSIGARLPLFAMFQAQCVLAEANA